MSFTYTLRTLRQSFRSRRPGAPFTRSSRRLELEQLETRLAPACTRGMFITDLIVDCDDGNNDIRVDRVGSNFVVTADGVTTTHPLSSVTTAIRLWGNGGNDVFSIMPGTAAGSSRNLDGLAGRDVGVSGGPDTTQDVLSINDQDNAAARTFALTSSIVTWTGGPTIGYSTLERLTLNAGIGNDVISVLATAAATPVTVNAGAGNDTVTIGDLTPRLTNILGAVTVHGGPDTTLDVLSINDQGNAAFRAFTLAFSSVTWTGGPTITYGTTVERLTLNAGTGHDAVTILSTAAGTPVTVNAGAGNDVVLIGSAANSLATILGNVTINGGSDTTQDALILEDQGNAAARTFTLTNSLVTWTGGPTITYGTVENLILNAGTGHDVVSVLATAADTPVTVNTRAGNDVVYVGNHDRLTTILGNVTVNGGSDTTWDLLMLRDSDNAAARTFTVTNSTVTWTDGPTITYDTVERLFLNAGTGNDRVNIRSTAAAAGMMVNAGAGNDTVTFGSVANTLAAILGAVTVNGGPDTTQDVLNFHDQGSVAAHTYTLAHISDVGAVSWAGGPVIGHDAVERLTLNAGTNNDFFNILSTAAATPVTVNAGAGNDTVTLASLTNTLTTILGNVTVNGDTHTTPDVLNLHDQGNAAARTFTLTNSSVTWTGGPTISYGTLEGLTLNAGTGNDVVNIRSTAAATPVSINTGAGNDGISLGNSVNSLDDVLSVVTVDAGAGADSVSLNAQGTVAARSYGLNSGSFASGAAELDHSNVEALALHATAFDDVVSVGGNTAGMTVTLNAGGGADTLMGANPVNLFVLTALDAGVLDQANTFSSFENLLGSFGTDTFRFANDQAALSGWIDGGEGVNTLDYSAWTTGTYVDLYNYYASGALYVVNIQDVHGGFGDDFLHGDGQANLLVGNDGHDILLGDEGNDTVRGGNGADQLYGGGGADRLEGGAGEDLLIDGWTAYDYDVAALSEIWYVWVTAASYDERIAALRGGTPSGYVLDASTVFSDYDVDELLGQEDLDWFWATEGFDSLPDRLDPDEAVN